MGPCRSMISSMVDFCASWASPRGVHNGSAIQCPKQSSGMTRSNQGHGLAHGPKWVDCLALVQIYYGSIVLGCRKWKILIVPVTTVGAPFGGYKRRGLMCLSESEYVAVCHCAIVVFSTLLSIPRTCVIGIPASHTQRRL